MKKNIFLLVASLALFSTFSVAQLIKGKTLSEKQVQKRWGNKPFVESEFKTTSTEKKSEMTYQILLNKKKYIGVDVDEIRKTFGQPDGFYFIDTYPAYIIQEGKTQTDETWQIVFMLNGQYKVRDVIVHKNCCD